MILWLHILMVGAQLANLEEFHNFWITQNDRLMLWVLDFVFRP
jgi:hypothetical protein